MKHNNIQSLSNCQQLPQTQQNLYNPESVAANLGTLDQQTLAWLNKQTKFYGRVFHKQQTIADALKTTRRKIQCSLNRLKFKGIISWTQGHEPTCTYTINPAYRTYAVRKILYDKIKNLIRLALPICLLEPNGALLNVKGREFIYKQHQQHERVTLSGVRAREGVVVDLRKENVMSYNPIPDYILKRTERLRLTKWGQMALTAYNEDAILFADQQLSKIHTGKLNNPFGYFLSQCKKFCEANKIEIQWRKAKFLQEAYEMPLGAPLTLEKAPEPAKVSSSQKRESSGFFDSLAARLEAQSKEDPYVAALKVARHYAKNPDAAAIASHINPWFNILQKEDQQRIMEEINNERKDEENATHSNPDNAPFTTTSDQQPICHGPQA